MSNATPRPTAAEDRQTLKTERYLKKGNVLWGTAILSYWFSSVDSKHVVVRDLSPGIEGYSVVHRFDTIEEARDYWIVCRNKMKRFEYVRAS
jgi:hypothetical protein